MNFEFSASCVYPWDLLTLRKKWSLVRVYCLNCTEQVNLGDAKAAKTALSKSSFSRMETSHKCESTKVAINEIMRLIKGVLNELMRLIN